jgi:hypothetical protein
MSEEPFSRAGITTRIATAAVLAVACTGLPPLGRSDEPPKKPAAHLELRIAANEVDDKSALEAARKYFLAARDDAKRKEELERLAREGKPPLLPTPPDGRGFDTGHGRHTYTWVEVGPQERRTLNLDNTAEGDAKRHELWKHVAQARSKGEPIVLELGQLLLYSRDCRNTELPEAERKQKRFDYFLLMRDPEAGKAITGKYLIRVKESVDSRKMPAVSFTFDKAGGELMYEVTSKNLPGGEEEDRFYRHLAIILDDRIVALPTIRAAVRGEGMITGKFTAQEVQAMLKVLRSDMEKDKE